MSRRLSHAHGNLTAAHLAAGFQFQGARVPFVHPRARNLQAAADAASALDQDRLSAARPAGPV